MSNINFELEKIGKKIIPLLKKYQIKKAGIFGSYSKGQQKKNSDIDILVELDSRFSLYDLIGIKLELENKLNKTVDLVEYETIKPELKEIILNEEIPVKI